MPIEQDSAVTALLARWIHCYLQARQEETAKAAIEARIRLLKAQMGDCQAGFRAFGFDWSDEADWTRLWATHADAAMRQVGLPSPAAWKLDADAVPQPATAPRVAALVLERLTAAGAAGSRAAPITAWIRDTHRLDIHYKTVGTTLKRLLRAGRVRRKGHTWFVVERAG